MPRKKMLPESWPIGEDTFLAPLVNQFLKRHQPDWSRDQIAGLFYVALQPQAMRHFIDLPTEAKSLIAHLNQRWAQFVYLRKALLAYVRDPDLVLKFMSLLRRSWEKRIKTHPVEYFLCMRHGFDKQGNYHPDPWCDSKLKRLIKEEIGVELSVDTIKVQRHRFFCRLRREGALKDSPADSRR